MELPCGDVPPSICYLLMYRSIRNWRILYQQELVQFSLYVLDVEMSR